MFIINSYPVNKEVSDPITVGDLIEILSDRLGTDGIAYKSDITIMADKIYAMITYMTEEILRKVYMYLRDFEYIDIDQEEFIRLIKEMDV